MSLRPNVKQLYISVEPTLATAVAHGTLVAAGKVPIVPRNVSIEEDPDLQDPEIDSSNFTRTPGTTGIKTARIKFSARICASDSPASAPQWHDALRACGFRNSTLTKVVWDGDLGTSVKQIPHGTLITQGSNVLMVYGAVQLPETPGAGLGVLYCGRREASGSGTTALSGASDMTLAYNGSALGTIASAGTPTVTATAGQAYHPFTDALSSITFDATGNTATLTVGDVVKGVTSGALGIVYQTKAPTANASVFIRKVSGYFSAGETISVIAPAGSVDADVGVLAASSFEAQECIPTLSIGVNDDGAVSSGWGMRGNAKIIVRGGKVCDIEFDFLGGWNAADDRSIILSGVSEPQRTPPVALSAGLTFGPFNSDLTSSDQLAAAEYQPCASEITFDTQNKLEIRECMNSSVGALGCVITGRDAVMNVDPEATYEAVWQWKNKLMSGATQRGTVLIGATSGSPDLFQITWKAAQMQRMSRGERKGLMTNQVQLSLTKGVQASSIGNDEFCLIWRKV